MWKKNDKVTSTDGRTKMKILAVNGDDIDVVITKSGLGYKKGDEITVKADEIIPEQTMNKFDTIVESVLNEKQYVKNEKIYMYNTVSYQKFGRLKRDLVISTGSSTRNPSGIDKVYQLKKGDIINVDVARDGTTWIEAGLFPSENLRYFKYIVRGKPAERFSRDSEVEYLPNIKTHLDLDNERKVPFKEDNYKGQKV